MNSVEVMKSLTRWDHGGRSVFTVSDLRAMFPERAAQTFSAGLRRLVAQGILERVARGVYVNPMARSKLDMLDSIAVALRRGESNYVSLESALADYSIISQQNLGAATVMTTGRKGTFSTPYGTIVFTHTSRSAAEILDRTIDVGRPLRQARPCLAFEDLKHVGRNLHLVDMDALDEVEEEFAEAESV